MSSNPPLQAPSIQGADIVIIGAGAIGLALAATLSGPRTVAVLERHTSFGRETSSHGSGVIHAGLYYPPDWLKTRLAVEGNALLYQWAQSYMVRYGRPGKLVLAVEEDELPALEQLHAEAQANDVPDLQLVSAAQVKALEPEVQAAGALLSGSSGIIAPLELLASYLEAASERGAVAAFGSEVVFIERRSGGFRIVTRMPQGEMTVWQAGTLINAAGLWADYIGALAGYDPDGGESNPPFRQTVNRGRYYEIRNRQKLAGVKHLLYPLPPSDRTGLGVHLTLDIDGNARLGPDTLWLPDDAPLDYAADDDRGEEFLASAQRYLPSLAAGDLAPGKVGYRPKLSGPGKPPRDFLVWQDDGYVHLGGMESPGLTASLAIARYVGELLGLTLD